MSEPQSIVFSEASGWTPTKARRWAIKHGFRPIKHVDRSRRGQLRYRLQPPGQFSRFVTKKLKSGISLVIGFP